MCKKTLCQNCNNCPMSSNKKNPSWQQEQRLDDLRLELDILCEDITLYKQQEFVDENVLHEMQERLLTTYNHAVKIGLSYQLEEL